MEHIYQEMLWEKRGRPPELYPDASSKDTRAPDPPVSNYDCDRLAWIF